LYKDGYFIGRSDFTISNGEKTTYGNTGLILAFILVICMALMFTSSPTGVIIGTVMGLIMVSGLVLIDFGNTTASNTVLALSSGLVYIIVVAIAIIWKINQSSGGTS
jgi:hypothetical protein